MWNTATERPIPSEARLVPRGTQMSASNCLANVPRGTFQCKSHRAADVPRETSCIRGAILLTFRELRGLVGADYRSCKSEGWSR